MEGENVLAELLHEAENELMRLRTQAAELDRAERRASEKVAHLRALVELEDGSVAATGATSGGESVRSAHLTDVPLRSENVMALTAVSDKRPEDIAAEVLSDRGPLHYQELWTEVARRGGLIVSGNPAAVLLTRISRDERFAKGSGRGIYRLVLGERPTRSALRRRGKRRLRRGRKNEITRVPK